MSSTFFGLDLALRALQAQQTAVDVTNHNVANANTRGYSRQSAVLATTPPYTLPGLNRAPEAGQMGTGVVVNAIQRARDGFLDLQYRTEIGAQQQAQVLHGALREVEIALNEPSDSGLSTLLGRFFGGWQALANDPGSPAARAALVQQASALATGFNRTAQQLAAIQQGLNEQVALGVAEVNSLATQVAALNGQIVQAEALGQRANDLRDRRDLLLDQLAEHLPIAAVENADGSVDVAVGGHGLVAGLTVDLLTTTPTAPGGLWEIRFTSDNALAATSSGKLKGLLDARDTNVPGYLASLNALAGDLIAAVNGLHSTGYGLDGGTGRAFFTGADAATIAVDAALGADPARVAAASAPNERGNNTVALAIARLRQTMSPSPEDAFGALVARLGADSRASEGALENQTLLVQLLDRRRQAVSGVSLDEETVNLLRFQRAYEAAARLITANDQMLDTLINSTGIVGR